MRKLAFAALAALAVRWAVPLPALWAAPLGTNDVAAAGLGATNGLIVLKTLVKPSTYGMFGFASAAEAATATSGEPLHVFQMPLSLMASFASGQDPYSLLQTDPRTAPPDKLLVPVLAAGKVRSSVTLERQGAFWAALKPGRPRLISSLLATAATIPAASLLPGTTPFAVEVELYDAWLIGYRNPKDQLVLVAVTELLIEPLPGDADQIVVAPNQALSGDALYRFAFTSRRYNDKPN